MSTELVVDRDKLEALLPLLGAEVNKDGYIVDLDTGNVITSPDDKKLTIDEIGYIGHGSIEPVEDNFSSIVSYLSDRSSREDTEA